MRIYRKHQINKVYEGNLGKTSETNKARGIILLLLTNLYTGYFYSYIIFTLGTYIYCYHRSPVKINLKGEKRVYIKKVYIKKERKKQTNVVVS